MVHRLYHDQSWMPQRAWMHMATSLLHIQFRLPCAREKFAIIELQTLRFICYYRIPNVEFAIIGLQTLRHCYYKIWTPFNQFSWRNTCICDMIWRFCPWPFFSHRMPLAHALAAGCKPLAGAWPLAACRWPAGAVRLAAGCMHAAGRRLVPACSCMPLPQAGWPALRLAGRPARAASRCMYQNAYINIYNCK
jgi:hypothetical protein